MKSVIYIQVHSGEDVKFYPLFLPHTFSAHPTTTLYTTAITLTHQWYV